MERKELDTYLATKKRINDFCDKVIQKLEADYEGVLEGDGCYVTDIFFAKDFIEVAYSFEDEYEDDYDSSFTISYEVLLSENVDACAEQIADEVYSFYDEMEEEEGFGNVNTNLYMN